MDIARGSAVDRRTLTYRPGLDGVRALAVTAVLLVHHYGHYHPRGWTSGGFLGVDVFFVLSGFLITSLLLKECAGRGTISLPSFWARRIRRLVPPLIVLALGVAAYAIFRAPPASADRIRDEGVATFLYVKNWHTIFSQVSQGTPFSPTWSLAIEEQWYIIWPPIVLLLVGVFKLRRPALLTIIAVLAVASAADMAVRYHGGWDLRPLYNGTDTRAQALLVGAALAVLLRHGEVVLGRLERFVLEAVGIAALLMLVTLVFVSVQNAPWLYRGGFFYVALVERGPDRRCESVVESDPRSGPRLRPHPVDRPHLVRDVHLPPPRVHVDRPIGPPRFGGHAVPDPCRDHGRGLGRGVLPRVATDPSFPSARRSVDRRGAGRPGGARARHGAPPGRRGTFARERIASRGRSRAMTVHAEQVTRRTESVDGEAGVPFRVVIAVTLGFAGLFVIGLVALARRRWVPMLDDAVVEWSVRDVFSRHPPLLSIASRIGRLQQLGHHPGPLQFYLMAPVYRVLGSSSWALQASVAAVNVLAIAVGTWIASRIGRNGVVVAVTMFAALVLGLGFDRLFDPFPAFSAPMWFATFLLAGWAVLEGRNVGLPVLAFAGSFCAQTHIGYLGIVGVLGAFVLGWALVTRRAGLKLWLVTAAMAGLVLWLPPLREQLTHSPGNLSQIWLSFRHPQSGIVGFARGARLLLAHLDPGWMARGAPIARGVGSGPSTIEMLPGVVLLLAWLAGVSQWKQRPRSLLHLDLLIAVATIAAWVSIARIAGDPLYYLTLWGWVVQTAMLVSVGWTVLVLVTPRRLASTWLRATIGVTIVALICVAISRAASVEEPGPWISRPLARIMSATTARLAETAPGARAQSKYLVTITDPDNLGGAGPAMVNELERSGFRAGMLPPFRSTMGPRRTLTAQDATAEIHIAVGPDVAKWRGRKDARMIAFVDPRDASQRREWDRLDHQVRQSLRRAHLEALIPVAESSRLGAMLDPRTPSDVVAELRRLIVLGQPMAVFVTRTG